MEKKVGYCYPSGLEKTLCKWDIYVPLVTKGLKGAGGVRFLAPENLFLVFGSAGGHLTGSPVTYLVTE